MIVARQSSQMRSAVLEYMGQNFSWSEIIVLVGAEGER
jgi:hypothetical protein